MEEWESVVPVRDFQTRYGILSGRGLEKVVYLLGVINDDLSSFKAP
jgi:hypothetical protein